MRVDAVVAGLGASLDLRVLFEARDLDAKVSLEFQPSAPFVSRSRVSLMEPPRTSLRIAPEGLGGLSLTDLPGVDGWLKSGAFVLFALHAVAVSFAERLRFSPTHPQPSVSTFHRFPFQLTTDTSSVIEDALVKHLVEPNGHVWDVGAWWRGRCEAAAEEEAARVERAVRERVGAA
ncbi:uncharacterized protein MICPUCDRAFT_59714 [Micromonas pusilla CCMP1545]|jgi:hypothetical protein|uniref:Predicted protein n=1 Tax=Micromonas pusilla (strain CCMP1545) TaxID=564608 RepID=C1MWC4_MICPC|nr:uncharacterized protein MICPUCDRAFT_59714 [Micromonas pusilla CCMP1545]EEH55852.1 predicted protein [Micromonas pusilla CCMP1545]|tara:strand:+ start:138 stop:665 length:528 start_codon:yes stop_codon:yes gene_type:complete|eukprot:XP_003059900.1 predicted protein [Micromonas pusilla CCMP1545]